MKKVLFIDRDGTLIKEPPVDFQVDSLEKLEYLPGVFRYLSRIAEELEYELVLVTNQDGLGTESFPMEDFLPAQNKMLQALEGEGIRFADIFIDRSFPHEKLPTRKPGTALLSKYIYGAYDLKESYVIGDRKTDVELAKNLGSKSIFLGEENPGATFCAQSWKEIYQYLKGVPRTAEIRRTTLETDIHVALNLDGEGKSSISTGLGFFDHMLEQISRHSGIDLKIEVRGDLHIDEHHTVEDTALALGQAFERALGAKKGIGRYGFLLPMDESLAQVAIDFSGRPWLVFDATFSREKIGDVPTEMFFHFFKSFCDASRSNLNIKVEGSNEHHMIESVFKAFARALRMAVKRSSSDFNIPSTKGSL